MYSIESIGAGPGFVPIQIAGNLGQTQTVSTREVTTELTSRGYRMQIAVAITPAVTPPVQTTTPAITKSGAIKRAVDESLRAYGYASRSSKIGGYALSQSRFNGVVSRAVTLANGYLRAATVQTRTTTITATPTATWTRLSGSVSPRLRGIGGTLYGLGQLPNGVFPGWQPVTTPGIEEPKAGLTFWEYVALISSAVQGVASTTQAYANARAERERVGLTATLTANQIKSMVNEAVNQNPTLSRSQLTAAAAGAAGQDEPKGMPGWVVPVVVGVGVVSVMSLMQGRRR